MPARAPARTRAPATSAETRAKSATRARGDARDARGADARDDDLNEKDDRSDDDDDDDDDDACDDAWGVARGERDVRAGMIRVRSTVPLIVSTLCVVVTALIAVCAQSWHVRETAMRLASVRLSATSVKLGPTTRRLTALEDAVRRLESEKASVRAVDGVKATVEAERAANAANAATTTTDAKVVKTEMKAELKSVLAQIDALSKRQNSFVTTAELKKSSGALKAELAELEKTAAALEKKQANFAAKTELASLEKTTAALDKGQANFVTKAQLQKVNVANDLALSAERLRIDDAIKEAKSLRDAIDAVSKSQDVFITNTTLRRVESQIEALKKMQAKKGFFSTRPKGPVVSDEQIAMLEATVATFATHLADLEKNQADFVTTAQLQKFEGASEEIKSLQREIHVVSKKQANYVSVAQLQKLEVVTDEIKSLQSEISALAKTQDEFAILSASLKDVESKIAALADGKKKTGLLSKLSKKTDTKVTNKQLKALEDAIAALTKSQADFATVTQLKESAQALSQQQAGALTAADLKGIQKAVASLEKSQNGFATTAQLQKLEVVTDEIKSLQSEISALAKTQDEFAILSASLKDVESKIAALADGKKKTGLLSKLSKKTDTKVTNKQLKALEDAIAALTKSQADFATVTQLKKVAATLDALKNVHDNYATTKLVKNLELKLNQVIKTSGGLSTTQTNLVELEQRAMERVESYIKTIPKDTSRKLTKHIEEASSLWFADRTGRQDFALAPGGGRVVGHSQLSPFVGRGDGPITSVLSFLRSGVHPKSDEWLLTPSLEQPGDCIALHSSTGYVDVRLRQSVKVDAVTLEHANSLNAYDLHSAPRDVQVYGWHARKKSCKHSKPPKSLIPLGNYTYSINRGSVQTFDVVSPQTVDHVRLVVKNNQGHQKWTCLYRFRVHGVPERVEA